jgi:hypothetical protein
MFLFRFSRANIFTFGVIVGAAGTALVFAYQMRKWPGRAKTQRVRKARALQGKQRRSVVDAAERDLADQQSPVTGLPPFAGRVTGNRISFDVS